MACAIQKELPGIGGIKPIDRHEGTEQEILARREELFNSIKRNGRKPTVLAAAQGNFCPKLSQRYLQDTNVSP